MTPLALSIFNTLFRCATKSLRPEPTDSCINYADGERMGGQVGLQPGHMA